MWTSMLRFIKRDIFSDEQYEQLAWEERTSPPKQLHTLDESRGERDRLYKPKFGPYKNYGRKIFDTKKLFLKELSFKGQLLEYIWHEMDEVRSLEESEVQDFSVDFGY